jgi:hypothetical protein
MRRAIIIGAGVAILITGLVGALALTGLQLTIAEYLLFPGGLAAWTYKGDNYRSGNEFLHHTIVFGVALNALAGGILGALAAPVWRKWVKRP